MTIKLIDKINRTGEGVYSKEVRDYFNKLLRTKKGGEISELRSVLIKTTKIDNTTKSEEEITESIDSYLFGECISEDEVSSDLVSHSTRPSAREFYTSITGYTIPIEDYETRYNLYKFKYITAIGDANKRLEWDKHMVALFSDF